MTTIFYVLKEEYDRLRQALKAYSAAMKKQEQGAPQIKHIGNKDYLYLARRKGGRVSFSYVGAADTEKARSVLDSVKRRREYQDLLRGVKRDLKDVGKVLRGKI